MAIPIVDLPVKNTDILICRLVGLPEGNDLLNDIWMVLDDYKLELYILELNGGMTDIAITFLFLFRYQFLASYVLMKLMNYGFIDDWCGRGCPNSRFFFGMIPF